MIDSSFLEAFADAWNAHDIDRIMTFMTDDCVFEAGGGTAPWGERFAGHDAVRERFEAVWRDIPDAAFVGARHFVSGDRGCSEWTFTGSASDGTRIEKNGCDIFTFRDDKIWIKNTFVKGG